MEKKDLIKNLLLSFLPILIFVAADEYLALHFPEKQATQYALILAIGMGLLQALYVYAKEKRLDKMIAIDTLLIIFLGGVSLLSGSDIFFKVKPALVQMVMVLGLGFLAFFKPEMLLAMTGRIMKGVEVDEQQLKIMQRSTQGIVIVLFLHSLLIAYAAFYLSRPIWAFISGPLIYIVAAVYFLILFAIKKFRKI